MKRWFFSASSCKLKENTCLPAGRPRAFSPRKFIITLMLNPAPFALAFALSSIIFYAFLYLLKLFAPPFFRLLLDSQLLGAPIASQVPDLNFANFVGILIAVAVVAAILGYLVAVFYNKFGHFSPHK